MPPPPPPLNFPRNAFFSLLTSYFCQSLGVFSKYNKVSQTGMQIKGATYKELLHGDSLLLKSAIHQNLCKLTETGFLSSPVIQTLQKQGFFQVQSSRPYRNRVSFKSSHPDLTETVLFFMFNHPQANQKLSCCDCEHCMADLSPIPTPNTSPSLSDETTQHLSISPWCFTEH